jgi:hypothetical protein
MRHSSACCLDDSFGWRSRSLPLTRATAMPSRVRIRSKELGEVGEMLKNILPIGLVGRSPAAERQPDVASSQVVADQASGTERVSRSSSGIPSMSPARIAANAWWVGPLAVRIGQTVVREMRSSATPNSQVLDVGR